jgi:hypothetical protein
MNLRVKSAFLLICLKGTLGGWPQELPSMAVDVNTLSATSLERPLHAPQGVVAGYGLFGSHVGDGASSINHTGVASSPAAKSEVAKSEVAKSEEM